MKCERVALVDEAHFVRMCRKNAVDERDRHATMRAFEVGELDDYDRGVLRSPGWRPVNRYRAHPSGIEALLVRVSNLVLGRAVPHQAGNPFCSLRTWPACSLFLDALRHRDGHAWTRGQELEHERRPLVALARRHCAAVDTREDYVSRSRRRRG